MTRQRKLSQVIPFVRDEDGEYRAEINGIKFHLLYAIEGSRKTWAYTAYDADHRDLRQKPWLSWGSQKWAVQQCERILRQQAAQVPA